MDSFNENIQENNYQSQSMTDRSNAKQVDIPLLDLSGKSQVKNKRKKMRFRKKKSKINENTAGGGDSSMFGLTLSELQKLMEFRGKDLMEQIERPCYNGIKGILQKLKVDTNRGLDSNDVYDLEQRQNAYGKNEIPPKPMRSFLRLCWDALHDVLLIILLVCAIISIGLSFYRPPREQENASEEANLEWIEGVAILVAVLVVVLVTAINDWRKERQFRGLQNKIEKDQRTSVVRNSQIQQIPVSQLVVGDICFIKYGDLLPADGLIVQSNDLKIDESSITGETDLIKKNEKDDVGLLSGTHVMEGSGRMVVVGVGLNSQVGNIMRLLGATKDETKATKKKPKKERLSKVSPNRLKTDVHDKDNRKNTSIECQTKHPSSHSLPPLKASNSTETDKITQKNHFQPTTDSSYETSEKFRDNKLKNATTERPILSKNNIHDDDNDDDDDINNNAHESNDSKHRSVLQAKLTRLALYIGYIGMSAAFLTLISLIMRFCITHYIIQKNPGKLSDISYFISFLIQAITVVVVAVPEGLPLAVTLALAYAVRKMMTDNNLVRHLDACETMGNATTICSDKTGTLTTNRMTVVQCFINGQYYEQMPKTEEINKDILPILFESISVNTNYTSKIEESTKDDGSLPKQIGNKTECALLDLILKWKGSYEDIRTRIPENQLVKVYTFNSARKMMSTIIETDRGYKLYTKGASEMVLSKCKSIIGENNQIKDLTTDDKNKITHDIIEKMANNGLRTICITYKNLGKEKRNWNDEEKIINDLICIGIVGIEDPVRDEVPEAIAKCQKAGVIVRMVTGDNIITARSIATKCGILKPNEDFLILEGKEFNRRIRDSTGKISQKRIDEIWPRLRVLARSSPQDKYILVNGIVESRVTQHREVVAVTGDGTNDGPALKRADVGFAMGIQGTDVAKQASDIILTDDNFSSIVKAMLWGRNVYDCIAKFLQFQLTANLSAGIISVVSAAAISTVPLRAVQMLWVNLVMDTLASLALATEPPSEELLNRKPYGRTKSLISPIMLRNIIGQSFYQLVVMFTILYAGDKFLHVDSTVTRLQKNPDAAKELSAQFTIVFNSFVLMTLFNEINARKLHSERNVFKGIFRNPFFYCIWIGCFIAQILIVTFGNRVFSCARLDIQQWAWCLLFGVLSLLWQQIILFIPIEPFSRFFSYIYRKYCSCCCKKRKRRPIQQDNVNTSVDENVTVEIKTNLNYEPTPKYATISQLTTATIVTLPPPPFARYMLRKSVDRLNSEFRVINQFRSRLEELKEKRYEESIEQRRNSQINTTVE